MCKDAVFVENRRTHCVISDGVGHEVHMTSTSDKIIFWSGPVGKTKIDIRSK